MEYENLFEIVKGLKFDTKKTILDNGKEEVYILRPSKVSARFKDYDINKNFQIFLKESGNEAFRPNHLRVMIDLSLRVRSRPDLKRQLFTIFDNIFYHKDPEEEIKVLGKEKFEHSLNSLPVIGTLSQLFIIEQEYGYHKESNYIPPTLFYQGWVRAFIDGGEQVDVLSMSLGRFQPPPRQYTEKENKKDKRYNPEHEPQWYLESS